MKIYFFSSLAIFFLISCASNNATKNNRVAVKKSANSEVKSAGSEVVATNSNTTQANSETNSEGQKNAESQFKSDVQYENVSANDDKNKPSVILQKFEAVPGENNGTIKFNIGFPENKNEYSKFELYRIEGKTPPDCGSRSPDFQVVPPGILDSDNIAQDTGCEPDKIYSYRICLYDTKGIPSTLSVNGIKAQANGCSAEQVNTVATVTTTWHTDGTYLNKNEKRTLTCVRGKYLSDFQVISKDEITEISTPTNETIDVSCPANQFAIKGGSIGPVVLECKALIQMICCPY